MFKRIRNIWKLGEYKISQPTQYVGDGVAITGEPKLERDIPLGDGNAEFLGEGTREEYEEMEKEKKGLKGIFGL